MINNTNLPDLINKVEQWAAERNLILGATQGAQYGKLLEEIGELGTGLIEADADLIEDSIGDSLVVLIILAAMRGLTIEQCLTTAYNEIKDRKGRMIDGKFVKEIPSV